MVLGVVLSLLASQPVYEWVDDEGQSHFTNLVKTIPEGVQRHEMTYDEPVIELPRFASRARPLAMLPAALPGDDQDDCELAQAQVEALEQQLAQQSERALAEEEQHAQECQQALNTLGQGAWLRCKAAVPPPPDEGPLRERLEEAREALRRAQVGGCR